MSDLETIFENNRRWAQRRLTEDPSYFLSKVGIQRPEYLWIGCSDSRVMANELTGLDAGELFVHRNIANLAPHTDFNYLSVLQFGVEYLRIRQIIVCGHYGCGGVQAALSRPGIGLADNWLRHIRDVYSENRIELDAILDEKERTDRLVELNIQRQVRNVAATTIVQNAWAKGQKLEVHGLVYDLEHGLLRDLGTTVSKLEQLDPVY